MSTALEFTEDQAMILDSARAFCAERSPVAAVRALLESETGFDAAVWQEMVELGWPALAIPEEHGGAGLDVGTTVPLAESMGRALLTTPFFGVTLVAQGVLRGGSEEQHARWLPGLAGGTIATLALLDDGDWGAPTTTCVARREGDDFVVDGAKLFVGDAGVAEAFLLWCAVDGADALLWVPRSVLGETAVSPSVVIDQTRRAGRVDFTGARVPADHLLDPAKAGTTLRDLRLLGAMLAAAEATGSTAACLDVIVDYLKTRKQFGQYIGSYQALKHPTVDILNALDGARSLIYHAATVVGADALDRDAEIACRMAKAAASDALVFAGDRAVQFHGGMGFTWECDAQLYIRRAQWLAQVFGDPAHHRRRLADLLL